MTLVVGLTGGIGCGKSSVSKCFSDLGIEIIDTDVIAHTLTQSQGLAIEAIREAFGDSYITEEGVLNRVKMRDLVFSDSCARKKLEFILHPLILKETILQAERAQTPYIIIVIPLLFETNDYNSLIQRILVVDCEEQQQISRTKQRSRLTTSQIEAIMATQITRNTRLQKAHDIITNDQNIEFLKIQVNQLHHRYLALSNQERVH